MVKKIFTDGPNGPIILKVGCRGNEAKLVDCSHSRVTLCQGEVAGVVCPEGVVDTSMQL